MAPAPPAVPAGVTANLENDSETRAPVTGPSAWSPACRLAARSRAPCSSAIFFTTDAQKATAERVKAKVDASGKWGKPIVTQIVAAGPFWEGEGYHQDYLQKNPGGYTCHWMRD